MLRRSLVSLKVSRNWTKKSLTSKSHFPLKAVDPATLRDSAASAKEQKVFHVTKDGDPNARRDGYAARMMSGVRNWSHVVRLQQPAGALMMLLPAYWGTGMAVTRTLIFEGADPIVLCAPLLPIHLIVLLSLGTFTLRAAGLVANDILHKESIKKTLSAEELAKSPIINGTMAPSQAGGILAAHATIGTIVALNLSPAAISALCAALPLAALYPILQRTVWKPSATAADGSPPAQSSNQIIAHALFMGLLTNAGIFVGYGAVNNRIDLWLCVPVYAAAVMWTCVCQILHSYEKRHEAAASAHQTLNDTPLAANLAVGNIHNPFAGQTSGAGTGGASPAAAAKSTLKDSITNTNVNRFGTGIKSTPPSQTSAAAGRAAKAEQERIAALAARPIGDKLLENKLLLILLQFPIGALIATGGLLSPQSIFFYIGLGWSSYYLSSVVDHANIYDRWSCARAYRRNVRYAVMVLLSIMAGNAFWAYASEYEPHKDQQSISEQSTLKSAISFGNAISPRSYDASQFTWVDRFLKPAFVQGQALAARGVPAEDIVIPAWMRREHFGENCSRLARLLLGGVVAEETICEWEQWWYSVVDHYNLLARWSM